MAGYIGNKAVNLSTSGADISGTANLDAVDIDGAVNMATTALVTGVLTTTAATVFNGGFASNADSTMGTDKKLIFRDSAIHISSTADGDLSIAADDEIDITSTLIDINGAVDMSSTLATASTITVTTGASTKAGSFVGNGIEIKHPTGASNLFIGTQTGNDVKIAAIGAQAMRLDTNGSERMRIDATGAVTMPHQPAFQAMPATQQSNIATNTNVTVVFGTERFDNNADFASNTFTAPVTGKYQFNVALYLNNIDTAADYYELRLTTSNKTYFTIISPEFTGDLPYFSLSRSVLADMDANDTCFIALSQSSGTAQTDITVSSTFSGYLVA